MENKLFSSRKGFNFSKLLLVKKVNLVANEKVFQM